MAKTKFFVYLFMAVFLTLGLSISLQSLLAAWSPPTANPPGNNANPPVYNVSGTPAINNRIDNLTTVTGNLVLGGTLTLSNYLRTNGNWITNDGNANEGIFIDASGNVGIGKSNPAQRLDVEGTVEVNSLQVDNALSCVRLYTDAAGNVACANSLSWYNLISIPAGFADGVDDTGIACASVGGCISCPCGACWSTADLTHCTYGGDAGLMLCTPSGWVTVSRSACYTSEGGGH